MLAYFNRLTPRHRRSWALVAAYLGFLFLVSFIDFGANTAGQTIFRGVLLSMLIFLVASGLSLIFGLLDVLNFGQGAFVLVGAYVGYATYQAVELNSTLSFLAAAGAAIVSVGLLGAIIEAGLIRPLYERPVFQIVLTFGLAAVLIDLVERIWGPQPNQPLAPPEMFRGTFYLFGQSLSVYRLFIIALGLIIMIAVGLLLNRTRLGIIIRAGVQDAEMVQALGINVRRVFTFVFVLGAVLAGLAGIALVPYQGATLDMGNQFLIMAIVVVVIGGMGSYEGTAVASFIVGLTRAVAEQMSLKHFDAPVLAETSILLLMIAVLLIQPSGLFGREES
jgi:branched-chain amino acid transport system permease protein